jgi:hypothetical protein
MILECCKCNMAALGPGGSLVTVPDGRGGVVMLNDSEGRERPLYWDSRDGLVCPRCGRSNFDAANEGMPEADVCSRCHFFRGLHPVGDECASFEPERTMNDIEQARRKRDAGDCPCNGTGWIESPAEGPFGAMVGYAQCYQHDPPATINGEPATPELIGAVVDAMVEQSNWTPPEGVRPWGTIGTSSIIDDNLPRAPTRAPYFDSFSVTFDDDED